ncbi:MAG: leucine--tRNA ligase [Puniceicoccales bacterium]|jgi:leucyl-tRNA synthetase|nr:leucine--tRNA ligase [Puniceicoccales bacterium]
MNSGCKTYDFSTIERHWHGRWASDRTFRTVEDYSKEKYYVLDMFPYPSGTGLHIGHPEGYTASDIITRYKMACGYNVLHPMGWDAFGLPAEQHAIKTGLDPAANTASNIDVFREQIQSFGFAIDWEREVNTTNPNYFRWTQWIFLQMFKHGLAYVDEKPVWWCSELKSVLSNEEVIGGKSERGEYPVERKNLRQWVLRITKYADRLLEGLGDVDWPDSTKRQQIAWIGKSTGAHVTFKVENYSASVAVYTTRPDTLFGATFVVLAPEHELVSAIVSNEQRMEVEAYIAQTRSKSDLERTDLAKDKTGVFTGAYVTNPINGERLPVWIADYVLCSYGTGAIMAVPAHDDRDYEFAKKYNITIRAVIHSENSNELPFCDDGKLINSGEFTGLDGEQARKAIIDRLVQLQSGVPAVNYKLRDWLFSRQRYWGEPIPIIWVEKSDYDLMLKQEDFYFREFLPEAEISYTSDGLTFCAVPLTSSELPLVLPKIDSYIPSDNGESPLAKADFWTNVYVNPISGEIKAAHEFDAGTPGLWIRGRRETNTMPQWAGSCWYYLRYMSPRHSSALVEEHSEKYWQRPDMYIGGAEHAVLHLLYARFWHKFLYDIGAVSTPEPFKKLFHQGIILGEDGTKMSKSRGNVVNPDDVIGQYGADALRLYEMFLGPLEAMKPWSTRGIEGVSRFLKKIWHFYIADDGSAKSFDGKISQRTSDVFNETVGKVTQDIENLRFNTAISQLMICLNTFTKEGTISKEQAVQFLQLLVPFAPHIAEEIYSRIDGAVGSVSFLPWPKSNGKVDPGNSAKIAVQINGKIRGECHVDRDATCDQIVEIIKGDGKFSKFLTGKNIAKVIFVPAKLVNIVVE